MAAEPNHNVTDSERKPRRVYERLHAREPPSQVPLQDSELRRLNELLEEQVQARTAELQATIRCLQDEAARRMLAEGKLRRRSQMLEVFFQHTITPLAFLDRSFHFVRVNGAYAEADGKTPEYFVGKNHFTLYPDARMREIFERVVRTKRPYRAHARPLACFDGPQRVRYWNWQLTPLLNDAGEVRFLVFNLEDVTSQQKALNELQQRAHQLQKLTLELSQAEDRERRRLAEVLHDDLQQVLAAAKFHLGLLSAQVQGNGALEELAGQVANLLREAIGKSRSLSHELSPAVLYQSDLGGTFEWLARQVQAKHGLVVHVEVRGRIDPQSETLRAFLYKAGREMLFNVAKHAGVSEARLRLQHVRRSVWLTISDKGCGFDPSVLGKGGGFGLLSIHERVQLLGGRMRIKTVAGKGSTFLISVPDHECDSREALGEPAVGRPGDSREATAGRMPEPASHRLRVLLVDDHKVVREGLAALLDSEQDIDVVGQAASGPEAVEMAMALQPDVVVMDVAMPAMAGDEAARSIGQYLPQTRIVALSMFEETSIAERMRRAGAQTYLLKTSPAEELLAAIRGVRRNLPPAVDGTTEDRAECR